MTQSEFEDYVDQLAVAPEIEIDSVPDELGELYRVWNSYHLLGTFYQNLEGKWVAQPCNNDERPCCDTAELAQLFIIAVNGLPGLVSTTSINSLIVVINDVVHY